MTGDFEEQELKDRLSLIETMIAEGRRTTERWGWTFVLWGVAYYVAIVWVSVGPQHPGLACDHDCRQRADGRCGEAAGAPAMRRRPSAAPWPGIWIGMGISHFRPHVLAGLQRAAGPACLCRHHRRHAGDGERDLEHHSQVEDAIRVRTHVVGDGRGGVLCL